MGNGEAVARSILRPGIRGRWHIFRLGTWHVANPQGRIVRDDLASFRHALLYWQGEMVQFGLPPKKPPVQEALHFGVPR